MQASPVPTTGSPVLWHRVRVSTPDPQSLFPGKQFISTALEVLETKTTMSGTLARRYLQRAAMAGVLIGLMYATTA